VLAVRVKVATNRDVRYPKGVVSRTRGCVYKSGSAVALGFDANTFRQVAVAKQFFTIQKTVAAAHLLAFRVWTIAGRPAFTYQQRVGKSLITYVRVLKGAVLFAASVPGNKVAAIKAIAAAAVPKL